jgi:hypothetical protein
VVVSFIGGVTQETTNLQQGIVNVYHTIFNNIRFIVAVSFIGGGNRRKPIYIV